MQRAVLYTGTFDPYHLGHIWQLEHVYRAHPFDKVVVAAIRQNPKKPHATSWQHRVQLAKLALDSKPFPFEVEVQTIGYIKPDKLRRFVAAHLKDYEVTRTVASDFIREFVHDEQLRPLLTMFHYAVVVRPLVGADELQQSLPMAIAKRFSYEIVHVQTEPDVSATDLRKDIQAAFKGGYITESQYDYIVREGLYRTAAVSQS